MGRYVLTVGVVAALSATTGAIAQEEQTEEFLSRAYVGFSGGSADYDDPAAVSNLGAGIVTGSGDDSDTAWKVFGGYRLNDTLAVEVGWHDFGETSFNGTLLGTPVNAKTELSGLSVAGVGTWPIANRVDVFGKAGLLWWDTEGTSNVSDPDDDGIDALFGVGARYNFTQQFSLRGEWEWFNDIAGSDLSVLSVGVSVGF